MAGIGVLENAKLTHSAVVAASGWKSRTPKFMNGAIWAEIFWSKFMVQSGWSRLIVRTR